MIRERILITGANGDLGGRLVREAIENTDYDVIAVSKSRDKVRDMLDRERISGCDRVIPFGREDFFGSDRADLRISAAVHMAFSRANRPAADIADSLDYAEKSFQKLYDMRVPRIVYISSQSVYGTTAEWRQEDLPAAPETVYSMAKYAGEKLLEAKFLGAPGTEWSVLRLDYVIQSQKLVRALCRDAKNSGAIHLKGGRQTFSYIDRADVAGAITALLRSQGPWKPVYNVGPDHMRYTLTEIAGIVASVAGRHGAPDVTVSLGENDTVLWSGMDSTRFMKDTGWRPSRDIYQMVEAIYEEV